MYREIYKCRLCEEIYGSVGADSEKTAKYVVKKRMSNATSPKKPDLTELHICADGSLGVADFLGFLKESEEKKID